MTRPLGESLEKEELEHLRQGKEAKSPFLGDWEMQRLSAPGFAGRATRSSASFAQDQWVQLCSILCGSCPWFSPPMPGRATRERAFIRSAMLRGPRDVEEAKTASLPAR